LALLDEATSALDEKNEQTMYENIQRIEGLTFISVGHRPSLLKYHNNKLILGGDGGGEVKKIGRVERARG